MLSETVKLEKLRQKIEDISSEAGDKTDYLSYGKPTPDQAKQTQALIEKLNAETKSAQAELEQTLVALRTQQPQAIEEWVNYHVSFLQKIINANAKDQDAKTRKYVAQETLDKWELVRKGELAYVSINWHFLKEYRAHVRSISEKSKVGNASAATEEKAWWQFWK